MKTSIRPSTSLTVIGLLAGSMMFIANRGGDAQNKAPPAKYQPTVTAAQQKQIDETINRGVKALQEMQTKDGSWSILDAQTDDKKIYPLGPTALAGLTLLECGVRPGDPRMVKTANHVRQQWVENKQTYEIALSLLFLDRLGEHKKDKPIMQALALRLVAGMDYNGGWGYKCPKLSNVEATQLLTFLQQSRPRGPLALDNMPKPPRKGDPPYNDNSNVQFALLALWAARRHDIPVENIMAMAEYRFKHSQLKNGAWAYSLEDGEGRGKGSMTCVGLLGLALGKASAAEITARTAKKGAKTGATPVALDEPILKGLGALPLTKHKVDSGDFRSNGGLYFMWSVERIGVLYNLAKIGDQDWYQWGVGQLLPSQRNDGSWLTNSYFGSNAIHDTCFALLFLKRVNLVQDLTDLNLFVPIVKSPGG